MLENNALPYLKVHPDDNVIVALKYLDSGTSLSIENQQLVLQQNVPAKQKIFINEMSEGESVIMYGVLVGRVQTHIPKGGLMTAENTKHAEGLYSYKGFNHQWKIPDVSNFINKTFNGYKRKDGRVGTSNYWLFIPMVFCENRNMDVIKEALQKELGYAQSDKYNRFVRLLINASENKTDIHEVDIASSAIINDRVFKNVDGIKFLNHTGGCGGTRQDAATLSSLLAAYADHPNVGGVAVLR
jgi:altronate hydrolase